MKQIIERETEAKGCIFTSFLILVIIVLILIGTGFCHKVCGQTWSRENYSLHPNSIQLTVNSHNQSVGLIYGYSFRKPFMHHVPLGIYGQFSNTLPPQWHDPDYLMYNNYNWERKYSIGVMLTLPKAFDDSLCHIIATLGLVYNEHPANNMYYGADTYQTSKWGCDIGIQMQQKHFKAHLKADVINWMRYVEFGCGYCFSFHKSI